MRRARTSLIWNHVNVDPNSTGIDWDIDTISEFAANQGTSGSSVCKRLGTLMGSTENFVLLTVGRDSTNSSGLLTGPNADAERCEREMSRTQGNTCSETTEEVAEKERDNPGVFSVGSILPICMG